jgi:oxygen-independent coproporphyrinogen-3 oxidase
MKSEPGFGIYVHWPFCAAKCPYCDFNSHVRGQIDEEGWLQAVLRELAWVADQQGKVRPQVSTIFYGGGTPSLMGAKSAERIIETIAKTWSVANDLEITLEANPASVEAARFRDYRASGVNRLSLGIQSLRDHDLKRLGRLHDAAEARSAIKVATENFDRVSLDFIYARPDQTVAQWQAELLEALQFGTEHLSLYQLTIEPNTPYATLHRTGALKIPDDDLAADFYSVTQELTEAAGLPAYEISNHARPGAESRHNLLYWRYGCYAGVGPGAHGRLVLGGSRRATATERLPERWAAQVAKEGTAFAAFDEIGNEDAAREHLLMNLRLSEGLDLELYRSRWQSILEASKIQELEGEGLLIRRAGRLLATQRGRLVLNSVIAALAY